MHIQSPSLSQVLDPDPNLVSVSPYLVSVSLNLAVPVTLQCVSVSPHFV
jgi:hypothetical protein